MKIKRQKTLRKVLHFYKMNFNILEPYQILIDGTFAQEALKSKINLAEQIPKFFDKKKCQLLTTNCALQETKALGSITHGAMLILQQYKIQPCKHSNSPVNTEKCFKSLLESDKRFIISTQVFIAFNSVSHLQFISFHFRVNQ
jgi:U3 small nucleolar RNA-associated protein 23